MQFWFGLNVKVEIHIRESEFNFTDCEGSVLNKQNDNILIVLYKPVWSWENKDAISSGSATEPGGFCNNW
jgi:hypothetical protein